MKRFIGAIAVLTLVLVGSGGCYYDNEQTLYPSNGCDTANVKYSNQVTYIVSNKCYSCHSNATAPLSGNGVSFEGYANISAYLAISGAFLPDIKQTVGSDPMPKNQPKLSDCEIRTIEIWIQNGYPNN